MTGAWWCPHGVMVPEEEGFAMHWGAALQVPEARGAHGLEYEMSMTMHACTSSSSSISILVPDGVDRGSAQIKSVTLAAQLIPAANTGMHLFKMLVVICMPLPVCTQKYPI